MMLGAAGKYSADGEVDESTLTHARNFGPSSGDSVIDIPAFLPAATSSTDFHQFVLDVLPSDLYLFLLSVFVLLLLQL